MLFAVSQDGLMLQFASEKLRDNCEVVLTAVRQNGRALEFASERLKNDFTIVNSAIKQNEWSRFFIGNEFI